MAYRRPQEIDEAARRRFTKKLYIPLPEAEARGSLILNLLSTQNHSLSKEEIDHIVSMTQGYSGSDMDGLIREAALGPIRDIVDIETISLQDVRPITFDDFKHASSQVRASVESNEMHIYLDFDKKYGSKTI